MISKNIQYSKRMTGILCILVTSFLVTVSFAMPKYVSAAASVTDNAHLLSASEKADIEEKCEAVSTKYQLSIRIILSDTMTKKGVSDYFKKLEKSENTPDNLLVLFITTATKDTCFRVRSFCEAKDTFPEARCQAMEKKVTAAIGQKDYYRAIKQFCAETDKKANQKPYLDYFVFQSIPQLVFCMILSGILLYGFLYYHTRKEQRFPYVLFPFMSGKLSFLERYYQKEQNEKRLRRHLDKKQSEITNAEDTYTHSE